MKLLQNLKFNLGAFLLTPIWCFVHGKLFSTITLLVLYAAPKLLDLARPINLIFTILYFSFALYYGINGNKIALESGKYRDEVEFTAANKRWTFAATIWIIAYFVVGNIWHSIGAGTNILQIGLDAIHH
jgi:predicted Co/Zn/Cd cation transporter (cation efflux family)